MKTVFVFIDDGTDGGAIYDDLAKLKRDQSGEECLGVVRIDLFTDETGETRVAATVLSELEAR